MLHEPAAPVGKDPAAAYKAKLGIRLFFCYLLVYVVFVAINLGWPLLMERTVLFGMNLATVYGFGLIVVALLLALAYDLACRQREEALKDVDTKGTV